MAHDKNTEVVFDRAATVEMLQHRGCAATISHGQVPADVPIPDAPVINVPIGEYRIFGPGDGYVSSTNFDQCGAALLRNKNTGHGVLFHMTEWQWGGIPEPRVPKRCGQLWLPTSELKAVGDGAFVVDTGPMVQSINWRNSPSDLDVVDDPSLCPLPNGQALKGGQLDKRYTLEPEKYPSLNVWRCFDVYPGDAGTVVHTPAKWEDMLSEYGQVDSSGEYEFFFIQRHTTALRPEFPGNRVIKMCGDSYHIMRDAVFREVLYDAGNAMLYCKDA